MSVEAVAKLLSVFAQPFDEQKNTPSFYWDPQALVGTVGVLWGAMREQAAFLEKIDEVINERVADKVAALSADMKELIDQEAKERDDGDQSLRREMQSIRDDLDLSVEGINSSMDDRDKEVQDYVDDVVKSLNENGNKMQDELKELRERIIGMEEILDTLEREKQEGTHQLKEEEMIKYSQPLIEETIPQNVVNEDTANNTVNMKFKTLYSFIGVTPEDVERSVVIGTQTSTFLATPALSSIVDRIKDIESQMMVLSKNEHDFDDQLHTLQNTTHGLPQELDELREYIDQELRKVTEDYGEQDASLSRRIDDIIVEIDHSQQQLEGQPLEKEEEVMVNTSPSEHRRSSLSGVRLETMIKGLREELETRLATLKKHLDEKADKSRLVGKADVEDVELINSRMNDIKNTLYEHQKQLDSLRAAIRDLPKPMSIKNRDESPRSSSSDEAKAKKKDDDITTTFLSRLSDVERMGNELAAIKADKVDVNNALCELMKRLEGALNELLDRLLSLEGNSGTEPRDISTMDATLCRFRCLSCNRIAGPLAVNVTERNSFDPMPPSNIFMNSPSKAAGIPSVLSTGTGLTQFGTLPSEIPMAYSRKMSNSRRKLHSYYSWLQNRASSSMDIANSSTNFSGVAKPKSELPRSNTPPPPQATSTSTLKSRGVVHSAGVIRPVKDPSPWPGSQSGQGYKGDRQCGDHGSPDPNGIGTDGKYYMGVVGSRGGSVDGARRPQTAKHYRETCASSLNPGDSSGASPPEHP